MATGRRAIVRRTRPDGDATLADGVVADLFVAARVFGLRILSLDGRIVLSPRVARSLDPPRSPDAPSRRVVRAGTDHEPAPRRHDDAVDDEAGPRPGLAALARQVDDNAQRLNALRDGDGATP